jgi:dihydrofolate synthase / folylpolyglutamate synthase
LPLPALHGRHQIDNAGLACATLLLSNVISLDDAAFAGGVANAAWPGRLQPLTRGVFSAPIRAIGGELWIDGGHNAHGAAALARALRDIDNRRPSETVAIIGMLARKDAESFIAALASAVDRFIFVPLAGPHIAPEQMLAIAQASDLDAVAAPSLAHAMQNAAQLPAPRVLICGSFVLAAEALAAESA